MYSGLDVKNPRLVGFKSWIGLFHLRLTSSTFSSFSETEPPFTFDLRRIGLSAEGLGRFTTGPFIEVEDGFRSSSTQEKAFNIRHMWSRKAEAIWFIPSELLSLSSFLLNVDSKFCFSHPKETNRMLNICVTPIPKTSRGGRSGLQVNYL